MRSRNGGLRTVDVARQAGCSVQQVRDLEREGVLPPAARTAAGHRVLTATHAQAALAYRAFAAAVGPAGAGRIVRTANRGPLGELLALLDDAHARLRTERRDLRLAQEAARAIAAEPIDEPRPADAMGIGELADALGVRASTLRHWDAEGLVVPRRVLPGRARTYAPGDVRDARLVHQLRRAGHGIGALRELLPALRQATRTEEAAAALAARSRDVDRRSRALLTGTARLEALLEQ
ncbi:MerR family transcriptional regulator [Geodermatophilus sp. SYSU D00814]